MEGPSDNQGVGGQSVQPAELLLDFCGFAGTSPIISFAPWYRKFLVRDAVSRMTQNTHGGLAELEFSMTALFIAFLKHSKATPLTFDCRVVHRCVRASSVICVTLFWLIIKRKMTVTSLSNGVFRPFAETATDQTKPSDRRVMTTLHKTNKVSKTSCSSSLCKIQGPPAQ